MRFSAKTQVLEVFYVGLIAKFWSAGALLHFNNGLVRLWNTAVDNWFAAFYYCSYTFAYVTLFIKQALSQGTGNCVNWLVV